MDFDGLLTPPQRVDIKNQVVQNIRLAFNGLENVTLNFKEVVDETAEAKFENVVYFINIFRETQNAV